MEDHPDSQLLERFMRDQAEPPERLRVVRHLLTGCARCAATTGRLWSLGEEPTQDPPGPVEPVDATPYGGVFQRLAEHAERAVEQHLQGRDLIRQGILRAWGPEGKAEPTRKAAMGGILLLRQGLALLDERCDPQLVAVAHHRLALLLVHVGQTEAALAAFLEAQRRFLAEGLGAEAAEVLVDLALLYAREGRTAEVQRLTEDLLPIVQARGVRQGVVFALLFLRRLAETGHATIAALTAVRGYVAGPVGLPAGATVVKSGW